MTAHKTGTRDEWLAARLDLLEALGFCLVGSSAFAAAVLSKAQQDVVTAQIAELQMSEERVIALGWSDAKKVAQFICRPLAPSELKKWNKDADRVLRGYCQVRDECACNAGD